MKYKELFNCLEKDSHLLWKHTIQSNLQDVKEWFLGVDAAAFAAFHHFRFSKFVPRLWNNRVQNDRYILEWKWIWVTNMWQKNWKNDWVCLCWKKFSCNSLNFPHLQDVKRAGDLFQSFLSIFTLFSYVLTALPMHCEEKIDQNRMILRTWWYF